MLEATTLGAGFLAGHGRRARGRTRTTWPPAYRPGRTVEPDASTEADRRQRRGTGGWRPGSGPSATIPELSGIDF